MLVNYTALFGELALFSVFDPYLANVNVFAEFGTDLSDLTGGWVSQIYT